MEGGSDLRSALAADLLHLHDVLRRVLLWPGPRGARGDPRRRQRQGGSRECRTRIEKRAARACQRDTCRGGWEGEKMDSYVLVSGVSPRIFERLEWRQRVQLTDGNGLPLQNRELEDNMESVVKFLHENRWASPPCHLVQ